jgi:hypothetical protein
MVYTVKRVCKKFLLVVDPKFGIYLELRVQTFEFLLLLGVVELKISKTSWIIITVILLIIGGVLLGNQFNQQNQQKTALASKVALAKKKLAAFDIDQLAAQKAALAESIQSYTNQISADKIKLTNPLDNIDITNMLLEGAQKSSVEILEINSTGSSQDVLAGTLCQIQAINITILGTIDNSANFVYSLKNIFPTSVVKSVNLSVANPPITPTPSATVTVTPTPPASPDPSMTPAPSPSPNPSATPTPTLSPFKDTTATIDLVIYSYKGN